MYFGQICEQNQHQCTIKAVISRVIRPLAALYPHPSHTKKCSISAISDRRGRYALTYGVCVSFYCISLKNIYGGGGYNAVRGLISRDIAIKAPYSMPNLHFFGTNKGHILKTLRINLWIEKKKLFWKETVKWHWFDLDYLGH